MVEELEGEQSKLVNIINYREETASSLCSTLDRTGVY